MVEERGIDMFVMKLESDSIYDISNCSIYIVKSRVVESEWAEIRISKRPDVEYSIASYSTYEMAEIELLLLFDAIYKGENAYKFTT